MPKIEITCFKSTDIRGKVPSQLNGDVAYRVGRAYVDFLNSEITTSNHSSSNALSKTQASSKLKTIVVGHDVRLTSPELSKSLMKGLTDAGANVVFVGLCGTEEIYFYTFDNQFDGGICVTASHNPIDFNGMKFVREKAKPISRDNGLTDIQCIAEMGDFREPVSKGGIEQKCLRQSYIEHLLTYINPTVLKPLKIVCNAGNGGAGEIIDSLEPYLPFEFIKIHHEPDGNFPNGLPNPLLKDKRQDTIDAVKRYGADFGVAWDGDFDRCFFVDETGRFIEGYYIVGLLAKAFLVKCPGEKIVHDPRLVWNTQAIAKEFGGETIQSKAGHSFIKAIMRENDAVYGGEMSAHHYFRDFEYCDNGMIPWLLIAELVCFREQSLSSMVEYRMSCFPCSGEINNSVENTDYVLKAVEEYYKDACIQTIYDDGLTMIFDQWRFNLRPSSSEPVIRFNLETEANEDLMDQKTAELDGLIKRFGEIQQIEFR